VFDLQQREEYHGGVVIWSPRKLEEAWARQKVRRDEEELCLSKKQKKRSARLLRKLSDTNRWSSVRESRKG
jgi:hypothetical protein